MHPVLLFITSAKGNRAYPGKTSPRISIPRPLPLDNHCLRLDDGMKNNHLLTRIGTVFCQLDWNNEPESIWELALRFNAPQTPGDDKGLKRLMAKFTPNFDQEPWKYQALELIGILGVKINDRGIE